MIEWLKKRLSPRWERVWWVEYGDKRYGPCSTKRGARAAAGLYEYAGERTEIITEYREREDV